MSGVLVLSLSTLLVKIIGLAYKIPLLAVLGTEGMGYFNSSYEIFALLCGMSTTGVPVAVSMLIASARESGNFKRARGIFKTAWALLLTKGIFFSGLLAIFAAPIANALGNPDAYFAILAISPAILFSCASGAVRGYFQGCRIMMPTALSQLLEALGKLIIGVAFAAVAVHVGLSVPAAAAFAILGVSLGSLASAVYLLIRKRCDGAVPALLGERGKERSEEKLGRHVLELLRISLPITVGSALTGCTRIADMALIMRRLQATGVSTYEANKLYGAYTTLALPVFMLVPAFITPITESLIPRLSAAVAADEANEEERAVSGAVRLTVFLAFPSAMGIALYSEQILSLLFGSQTEAVAVSAPLLSALGASVLFSCLISTMTAVLQAYRRVILPIIALAVGAVVKITAAYCLIGSPAFGAMGAPVSTLLSNVAVLALDLCFVACTSRRRLGIIKQLPKPFFASLLSMLGSYALYLALGGIAGEERLRFILTLAAAVGIYFVFSVLFGVITSEDVSVLSHKRRGAENGNNGIDNINGMKGK